MEPVHEENPKYLSEQLITCLGNKRALLPFIGSAITDIRRSLNKNRIRFFDVFSGSGIVSRYARKQSAFIVANDLEPYAQIINQCYLSPDHEINDPAFLAVHTEICQKLQNEQLEPGIIAMNYAPRNDQAILPGERVFYTSRNARFIDSARKAISNAAPRWQPLLLAPLLAQASVHANTAGVFKGFYKNKDTGLGQFGGKNGDALSRITGDIHLPFPVTSNYPVEALVLCGDANKVCSVAPPVDIAYLDPPYNQHPYGSNYFMLNLITQYSEPQDVSPVSGIPPNWQRSQYNRKRDAAQALEDLIANVKARYVIVSFNSEGFIPRKTMEAILAKQGEVTTREVSYNAFRGSRNLRNRESHVTEFLFIVKKNN